MTFSSRIGRFLAAIAAVIVLAVPSQAYYHYLHFQNHSGPYSPIPDAFDLKTLPNNTLSFFVSGSGPATYGTNDSFGAVLSQVRQAAAAWNSVPASDLRVVLAGLESSSPSAATTAPFGNVSFQDLAPGLIGMGGVTVSNTAVVTNGQNGPFLPIARGLVILTNNTTLSKTDAYGPGPSYLDSYFTTAVHEFGHALGLQHTWTSAAMTQESNFRNTSRARPIDADDMAGLSVLYGKANWTAGYGSISGHVSMGGNPVALASVVAIPALGPAVSALTNPDGSYTIQGLPPNNYLLYVHPLPPDAVPADGSGLALPADMNGQPIPGNGGAFQTVFYPGTTDFRVASSFNVTAGSAATADFAVERRDSVPFYDVVTYSFLDPGPQTYTSYGSVATSPAYADVSQPMLTVVSYSRAVPTPTPRSVRILGGGFSDPIIWPYGGPIMLALYFNVPSPAPAPGPRHLVFAFGEDDDSGRDIYVLPEAINLVQNGPPTINSATPNQDGTVTVTGSRMGPDSRVYFDGLPASVAVPFSAGDGQGSITVVPPAGRDGQVSTLSVANSDGQDSMFWQTPAPPVYNYVGGTPQIVSVSPASLPARASAMVDVTASGTNFVNGQVTLGFGTADVTVRRVWVLSPTHLIANVVVAPGAAAGPWEVSVISGLEAVSVPAGFVVEPANPALPVIAAVVNGTSSVLPAGITATIYGVNLGGVQPTLNDVPATVAYASMYQINFVIPAGMPAGPAVLKLVGSLSSTALVLQIDGAAPAIQTVTNAAGVTLDALHPANPGDLLTATLTGIDLSAADRNRLQAAVSGVPMTIQQVTTQNGVVQVQFALSQSFAGYLVPLTVSLDGSVGAPYPLTAR
jgi:uncharacterized protein (TIGR03437 family)